MHDPSVFGIPREQPHKDYLLIREKEVGEQTAEHGSLAGELFHSTVLRDNAPQLAGFRKSIRVGDRTIRYGPVKINDSSSA